jgi:hypothetical protein
MDRFLKQSTASQSVAIGPFIDDTDFKTPETGLTIANTDIKLVVNGAASVNKNSGGGTHRINGVYGITFDVTDTATVGEIEVSVVVSGALPVFHKFTVLEEVVYDALFGASAPGYLQPTVAARTLDISPAGNAGIDWANIDAPTTVQGLSGTTVKTATDVEADTQDIQSRIPAALVGGRIDSSVGAMATDVITSTAIQDGALTAAKAAAGFFDAVWSVAARTLTAFGFSVTVGTNNDKTGYGLSSAAIQAIWDALTSALTTVGSIGKLLVDNINATITSRLASADITLAAGKVTVGTNDDKTGYAIGAGGIAATAFAAGAIDAAALAQDAEQEIADEILDRDIAGGGSGNTRNVRNALRGMRNKVQTVAGALTVFEEDDATPAWTGTVTRDATADPITVIDPS